MKELDKAKVYQVLAQKFGYTPSQIADMTRTQQQVLLGQIDNTITFRDEKQYGEWRKNR